MREDFLAATGSGGVRDFSDAEAEAARAALAAPNVIQEHVVSESLDRRERFEDVNLELIRACDVLVVLVRVGANGKPGGSLDAIAQACACGRTVLELRVAVNAEGGPKIGDEIWHHRGAFSPPALPHELDAMRSELKGLPPVADYYAALKGFTSHIARQRQQFFKTAALWVVGTHAAATLCAVVALKLGSTWVAAVLGLELLLLAAGFLLHEALHGSAFVRALRRWPLLGRLEGWRTRCRCGPCPASPPNARAPRWRCGKCTRRCAISTACRWHPRYARCCARWMCCTSAPPARCRKRTGACAAMITCKSACSAGKHRTTPARPATTCANCAGPPVT